MKKWLKYLLTALAAVVVILLLITVISFARLSTATDGALSLSSLLSEVFSGKTRLKGVTNILLLGVDNDDGEDFDRRGNADGIMLVSINTKTRELVLTSFMRDTKVSIDDYRRDKLTHVYHDDGIELFKEVFEKNFDVHIDNYALFNYLDIIDIVDELGGIDVEIAEEEIPEAEAKIRSVAELKGLDYVDYLINWYGPGVIHLNGVQTAGYMRIRPAYGGYDAGRTERTRIVASRLMDKLYKKSLAGKISFASTVLSKIETDMTSGDILKIALHALKLRSYDRISDRVPIDGSYTSQNDANGYYAVPDFEINKDHLQKSIYQGVHETVPAETP